MYTAVVEENGKVLVKYDNVIKVVDNFRIMSCKDTAVFLCGWEVGSRFSVKNPREVYKEFGDRFGVSLRLLTKMINGAVYRVYIAPYKALIDRLAYDAGKNKNDFVIRQIMQRNDFIKGFVADKADNVSAFGLLFDNPQNAKSELGKGLWKRLCANSKHKNDLIMRNVARHHTVLTNGVTLQSMIADLNELPSTVLKQDVGRLSSFSAISRYVIGAKHHSKRTWKSIKLQDLHTIYNIVYDTVRMCEDLGRKFDLNWSWRRIKKEHDECTMIKNKEKYSVEKFSYYDRLPKDIKVKGFSATLMSSPMDVFLLGMQEHHCVASYASSCSKEQYAVYQIVDDKGLVSTLGVSSSEWGTQHHHACNHKITDADRQAFGEKIIKMVKPLLKAPQQVQQAILEDVLLAEAQEVEPMPIPRAA